MPRTARNPIIKQTPPDHNTPIINWEETPIGREYAGFYVKIIDNVFTPEECAELIALAESDADWEQAAVNYGKDKQVVDTEYRNSERILRFDEETAGRLYKRLLPYISDLAELRPGDYWHKIVDGAGKHPGVWKLDCLNERLSFLKYRRGNYFRAHTDGQLHLADGRRARLTLQIYLGEDGVTGGATRILGRTAKRFYDVEPKKGRVLIFQQRSLKHTGEDVEEGTKYTLRSDFMFRYYENGKEVIE